jgi:predicted RNA-binding protein YlqC (UPF0109 family)
MVRAIVDHENDVRVEETQGTQTVVIELRVHVKDVAKVIGKSGAHADAIRTLLSAMAGRVKKRYILQIIENGHRAAPRR